VLAPMPPASDLNATLQTAVRRHHAGELEPAEALYRQVLAADPDNFDSLRLLGLIAAQGGRNAEAADLIGRAVAVNAGVAETHNHLGVVLQRLGRAQDAAQAYERAVALNPALAEAHNNLGAAHRELGRLDAAVEAYDRAIALKPDYAEAHNNLGVALRELGRTEDAAGAFERAVAHRPAYAKALVNLGVARQELGRNDAALEALDATLALDPSSAIAWHARSDLKRFAADDPDIPRMEALLADATADEARIPLAFALGKAWLDAGDIDRAFDRFDAGNAWKRAAFDYAVADDVALFERIAAAFPGDAGRTGGYTSELPVFVVGMPRSGTTLVEQILASHPRVRGAGELGVLEGVVGDAIGADGYPERAAALSAADLEALGRRYVECVEPFAAGRKRVVDKMPSNVVYAGLIHRMLPNARIIHCRRDPADTALSCYTKLFTGHQRFAYDLAELGRYYRAYDRLMTHWRAVLPADRFLEVHYEDVVEKLETEARKLIAFCGLDWDAACLDFHATQRGVRTASAVQVRRPIYRASVGRWKAYTHRLTPLLTALTAD
jgi:tetratricopeptide (TPR) repeat protein